MNITRPASGMGLLDIMLGLIILSVLGVIGSGSLRDLWIRTTITADVNEMSAILHYARQRAIEDQLSTVICPTPDLQRCSLDWRLAKMVFQDPDNNQIRSEDEPMLFVVTAMRKTNHLRGPARTIRFHQTGVTASPATLRFCHKDKEVRFARAITISLQGRVRLSQDKNNDGVHENNQGRNLDCL